MQKFQRMLVVAFMVLSIVCFFATGWVIYVEGGKDTTSIFMLLAFAVTSYWSFKKLREKED